jgi:hypothetical protein
VAEGHEINPVSVLVEQLQIDAAEIFVSSTPELSAIEGVEREEITHITARMLSIAERALSDAAPGAEEAYSYPLELTGGYLSDRAILVMARKEKEEVVKTVHLIDKELLERSSSDPGFTELGV